MIEVLVTVVILAFGLLGIAAFQAKAQVGSVESYQRAQAVVLMEDMHARISASPALAASYVTTGVGTGDAPAACNLLSTRPARDLCEWSQALRGTSEVKGGANVGAMAGARGCVQQVVAASNVPNQCQHGIYIVSVAWQGLHKTKPPAAGLACGRDLYGEEEYRRVISTRVSIGVPTCPMSPTSTFIPIP
ncbi:type IV pilus modification protein PilV [Massilia sp. PAMC28688]|nr:type IV pilus modification protein PilV [Massilia sp. PAMC28688]